MNGFDQLSNAIRMQSSLGQNSSSQPRYAEISSYDDNTHGVKVMIQPENQESGWMRLGAIGVGNGSGVAVGPNVGDMVLVVFAEGDFDSGNIIGRFFSTSNQAIPVPSGEIWLMHQSGSFVQMVTNGDIDVHGAGNLNANVAGNISASVGGDATINASGQISMTAPNITLNGAVTINGPLNQGTGSAGGAATMKGPVTVTNDLTAAGKSVSTHTHHENGAGSNTNGPN
jgi:phage baseplate assembly protein gpV